MSTIKREVVPGSFYHIYNRGTSKQKVFIDDSDKSRFTHLLYLCNGNRGFTYNELSPKTIFQFSFEKGNNLVEICSWVLMDNHFHLLIFLPENADPKSLSKFMSRLTASYLKYFNQKYKRSGNLFEGRYQAVLVESDSHLKYLYTYIHLNPLKMLDKFWKENLLKINKAHIFLNDYKFSSFHDLVKQTSKREERKILSENVKVEEISKEANTIDKLFSQFTQDPRGSWVV